MVRSNSCWVLVVALALTGCNNGGDGNGGGTGGSGGGNGGSGGGSAMQPALGFQPSNVDLSGHDFSNLTDVDVANDCGIYSDAMPNGFLCDGNAVDWIATQSDGTKIHVYVAKSFTVEPNAKMTVGGAFAVAIVSFGDLTVNGLMNASAKGSTPGAGGFSQITSFTKGAGPGGGPAGVEDGMGPPPGTNYVAGLSAGGGSSCGLGGIGTQEGDTAGPLTVMPAAATAAYGTADLRPIIGGSSGGVGGLGSAGAGGGALQLVAKGTLSIGQFGVVTAGGGGGVGAGVPNDHQEASGAGSGGQVLLEANAVTIAGVVAVNGGGGGGGMTGQDATPDANPAAGGSNNGTTIGGSGGAGATLNGTAGTVSADSTAGAGGGGVGRIRINSHTGAAAVTGTLSPSASTSCVSQGMLRATGSGI